MLAVPWKIECYLDGKENNPVEEFIEALPVHDRAVVRARIDFLAEIGNRAANVFRKASQAAEKDSFASLRSIALTSTYGLSTSPFVDYSRASPLRSF
jgi:hypothetical protein